MGMEDLRENTVKITFCLSSSAHSLLHRNHLDFRMAPGAAWRLFADTHTAVWIENWEMKKKSEQSENNPELMHDFSSLFPSPSSPSAVWALSFTLRKHLISNINQNVIRLEKDQSLKTFKERLNREMHNIINARDTVGGKNYVNFRGESIFISKITQPQNFQKSS